MTTDRHDVRIRHATRTDVSALCDILNTIIQAGGMTAFGQPFSHVEFEEYFLSGPLSLVCLVADDGFNNVFGFQALGHYPELPTNWADIATFIRIAVRTSGVGTALFPMTKAAAKDLGLAAINAAIRADNPRALAYYEKLGFETYGLITGTQRQNGLAVDRVLKRCLIR